MVTALPEWWSRGDACTYSPHRTIPQWAQAAPNKQLHESAGFNSYGEICQWLETQLGISVPYKTVPQLVHYRLKAAPKVARPLSAANIEVRVEAYKKTH